MKIYPAIRAQMGSWQYYIVRMKMREIAHKVRFAHDIYADKILSDAVHQTLDGRQVKDEMVGYLAHHPDRFVSSIVVAAMDGEPIWHPVEMDGATIPAIFTCSSSLRDSFGVLSFGDYPRYCVLDGQHRVAAIKLLVNGEASVEAPQGFDDDLLSVIVVLREEHDTPEGEWMRRYRRLFSSLNRHVKPADRDTNIIMSEDDLFAIMTRRLITEHEFFQTPSSGRESFKILTKGKNIKTGMRYFTTLQTLYAINEILLTTREREIRDGWSRSSEKRSVKQTRPDEDVLDEYYAELEGYWDAILKALPVLREQPEKMRVHDLEEPNTDNSQDHLLFWPIGQEYLLAKLVRSVLDNAFPDGGHGETDKMIEQLSRIAQIPWELHEAPWRYLLLVPTPEEDSWRMRSEDRKEVLIHAYRLLRWIVGLDPLGEDEIKELREDWQNLLIRYPEDYRMHDIWREVEEIRARIVTDK